MKFDQLNKDQADYHRLGLVRRQLKIAITEEVVARNDVARVEGITKSSKSSDGNKLEAKRYLPTAKQAHERAVRKLDKLKARAGDLNVEEMAQLQVETLNGIITNLENEYLAIEADLAMKQEEFDDEDDEERKAYAETEVHQLKERLALVEISHETVIKDRDKALKALPKEATPES